MYNYFVLKTISHSYYFKNSNNQEYKKLMYIQGNILNFMETNYLHSACSHTLESKSSKGWGFLIRGSSPSPTFFLRVEEIKQRESVRKS